MAIIKTLEYVFAIITLLGGVIAVHELGHFLFAKWCGIRVDTFSIGFGPKLFAKKFGETEYCLSLIPLGGFVKIYGQDPEELDKDPNPQPERAFVKKSLGQKISVLVGGPLFNYLMAIGIFGFMAMVGVQKLPPIATRIVANTPAFEAGLRSGDRILTVDSVAMPTFEDIAYKIAEHPDKTLRFEVEREGKNLEIQVPIARETSYTPYGEEAPSGLLDGFEPLARESFVATTLSNHPWGFKDGDKLVQFLGAPIQSWEDVEKTLEAQKGKLPKRVPFTVLRDGKELSLESPELNKAQLQSKTAHEFLEKASIYSPELFIAQTVGGSPAEKAGLKKGDRVLAANGKRVYSFEHLRMTIQQSGEEFQRKNGDKVDSPVLENAVRLTIEREGKVQELLSSINATKGKDPLGKTIVTYTIGILSQGKPVFPTNMVLERTLNPFRALWIGTKETVEHTVMTVVGIKKLAFGEVSMKTVGGPIMIGKLAGDTFSSRGWRDFLRIMAIISISLGVFNLLPVPILDGGHIVFAVIESIRGKPLSQEAMQWTLKVGLSLILVLMVFALYNDITRVIF